AGSIAPNHALNSARTPGETVSPARGLVIRTPRMTDPEASSSSASPRATFRLKRAHAVRVEQTPQAVESAVSQAQAELGLALRYELDGAPLLGLAESIVRLRPDAGTLAYLELSKRARHGALLT